MAYDEALAERIREQVADQDGVTEQNMFGGLAFLIDGNMSVAATGREGMLVRVDPQDSDELLRDERVTPMVMRGREMRGWLLVPLEVLSEDEDLEHWVDRGVAFARTLPPKKKP